jgi:hypothetical protein
MNEEPIYALVFLAGCIVFGWLFLRSAGEDEERVD